MGKTFRRSKRYFDDEINSEDRKNFKRKRKVAKKLDRRRKVLDKQNFREHMLANNFTVEESE